MTIREQVISELNVLNEIQLKQVADYLAFLKFRDKNAKKFDEKKLAELYAEFAEEDCELAEEDISDFAENLVKEDKR